VIEDVGTRPARYTLVDIRTASTVGAFRDVGELLEALTDIRDDDAASLRFLAIRVWHREDVGTRDPQPDLPEFKVCIAGSRDYPDLLQVHSVIDILCADAEGCQTIHVITGGASGVDTEAHAYASVLGLPTTVMPAEWDTHGRAAGPIRNAAMVQAAGRVVVLWDGKSKGAKNTIDQALKQHKPLEVVFP
jgi:hypothetical protein